MDGLVFLRLFVRAIKTQMKIKTVYISFVFGALLLALAACGSGQEAKVKEVDQIDFSKLPSVEGEGIQTLVSDSGKMAYRLEAPKLAIFDKAEKPYWDMPEGLHMTTFSAKGEKEGDIKSKFAIYYIDQDLWELRREVVAITLDGTVVETELLYWDRMKKEIYSDSLVTITEDDMVTTGIGFRSNEDFSDWSLKEFTTEFILDE